MEELSEKSVYEKRQNLLDLLTAHARLHYWYLGWKARMAVRAERKESEPKPKPKIKVISADEVPRGFIY